MYYFTLNTYKQCRHVIPMFQACDPCVLLTPSVIQDDIVVLSSRVLPLWTWTEVLY